MKLILVLLIISISSNAYSYPGMVGGELIINNTTNNYTTNNTIKNINNNISNEVNNNLDKDKIKFTQEIGMELPLYVSKNLSLLATGGWDYANGEGRVGTLIRLTPKKGLFQNFFGLIKK